MKQYIVDDIREFEMGRLKAWCTDNLLKTCFENVFWLSLDKDILNHIQLTHTKCMPFYLSMVLEEEAGRVVVDMVVRTARSMHCECLGFLDAKQLAWLDGYINTMFVNLDIRL